MIRNILVALVLTSGALFSTQVSAADKKDMFCAISAMIAERNFSIGVLHQDESESDKKGFFGAIAIMAQSGGLTPDQIKAADTFALDYFSTNISGFEELANSHVKLELSTARVSEIFATIVLGECKNNPNSPATRL